MLKLFVLRHGKAQKPVANLQDFDRRLTSKGMAQVNQVGYILSAEGVKIDQFISSGAARTGETAQIATHYLAIPEVMYDDKLYLAERSEIEFFIKKHATQKNVLLVGHNFGLSDFVSYLTGDVLVLSTGMLVEIELDIDNWTEIDAGKGTIIQKIKPNVHVF